MNAPHFELRTVYDDGSEDAPAVVPVTGLPDEVSLDRRGFFGTGLLAGAALLSHTACASMPRGSGRPLRAHSKAVRALRFRGGDELASGSSDKKLKVWSTQTKQLLRTCACRSEVTAVVDGGELLAAGSGDRIELWRGDARATDWRAKGKVHALQRAAGHDLVFSATTNGLSSWSLASNAIVQHWPAKVACMALAVDADAKTVLTASAGEAPVALRDASDGRMLFELAHDDPVRAVARCGDLLVTASGHAVQLWNAADGSARAILQQHADDVLALCVVPGSDILASADKKGAIHLWQLPSGLHLGPLVGHKSAVHALDASADGALLASGDEAGTIILWDLASRAIGSYLFDPGCTESTVKGASHHIRSATGQVITYTLPCGSPIPAGATCVCNCVPGTRTVRGSSRSSRSTRTSTRTYCSCVPVCTCVPICQAHHLLSPDPVARAMAEQLMLVMGKDALPYCDWAARDAAPALRARIALVRTRMAAGVAPDRGAWPSARACRTRLRHPEPVVAIMAAQMLHGLGAALDADDAQRVATLLAAAERRRYDRASR